MNNKNQKIITTLLKSGYTIEEKTSFQAPINYPDDIHCSFYRTNEKDGRKYGTYSHVENGKPNSRIIFSKVINNETVFLHLELLDS